MLSTTDNGYACLKIKVKSIYVTKSRYERKGKKDVKLETQESDGGYASSKIKVKSRYVTKSRHAKRKRE